MSELEDRIVAHHVGGRGFGVALNCPPNLAKHLVHVLYEADEICAREMIKENKNENFHVFPYCLGEYNRPGKIFITKNAYASSNLEPSQAYAKHYCELHLDGEVEGVMLQNAVYDVVYGNDNSVVDVRDVNICTLDYIMKATAVPQGLVPDFLSLDTQGSELNILKGGEQTFHNHCVALATEVEFHPMYKGQPLFSDIFDFALRHGFHFVGFTYLQEISPHRLPLGARAKGVVAFGDALFFRDIESVRAVAKSQNELYLMLLKLAFIALNFGYLEFALQAVEAAGATKPDRQFRDRLLERDCYRLLDDLKRAVNELPACFPHVDRSKMIAERKAVLDRARSQCPVGTNFRGAWSGVTLYAVSDIVQYDGSAFICIAPVASGTPPPMDTSHWSPLGQAAAVEQPAATPAPAIASEAQPKQQDQRIRHLLFTNPGAAIGKLVRHFRGPTAAGSSPTTQGADPAPVTVPPPSPHNTPVEAVLEKYGYVWWADVVRRRRKSAEHCIPGRMY
jgi:FkbM family methyltransferase